MGRIWSVRGRGAFDELRRRGVRRRSGPVSVTWCDDARPARPARPAVAYTVGRSVGGATVRNLVRRRLRSFMTGVADDLGAGTYLVGVRPSVVDVSYAELSASVTQALRALPAPGGLSEPRSAPAATA